MIVYQIALPLFRLINFLIPFVSIYFTFLAAYVHHFPSYIVLRSFQRILSHLTTFRCRSYSVFHVHTWVDTIVYRPLVFLKFFFRHWNQISRCHLRCARQIQWKTVRVGCMPVEYVEFRMAHGVQCSLDRRQWEVISGRVQHKSSVRVHWFVRYLHVGRYHQRLIAKAIQLVRYYKLPQRFQAVSGPVHGSCPNVRRYHIC